MSDRWAEWLRNRRDGGSVEQRRAALEFLGPIRDRILDSAEVGAGDVLLDVGCGDGLVGLGALDRGAQVIFSDISQACLDDCRAIAGDAAEYRLASAVNLGDAQADVVTTRSVLIYVADKPRAFAEFFRVLRSGGRLSIFEPINRFGLEERRATYGFRDLAGGEDLFSRVVAEVDRAEEGAGGLEAMIDFDERDLLRFAEEAGFENIRLKTDAPDVKFLARQAGGFFYLITVRRSPTKNGPVRFTGLPGSIKFGQALFEYDGKDFRSFRVSRGSFTEPFAPHDARVYRLRLSA